MSRIAGAEWRALGTNVVLRVTDLGQLAAAQEILRGELEALDLAASRFRDDSEIAAVNRAGGRALEVSPLFAEALAAALDVAAQTDGAVDPTVGRALRAIGYDRDFALIADRAGRLVLRAQSVPGWQAVELDRRRLTVRVPAGVELDLGATAKALCADSAATAIAERCACGALVNLGGDIAVAGPAPAEGWRVHVTDDHAADLDADGQTVLVHIGGLATSSTSVRRWQTATGSAHHIVDPATGSPAREVWRTVSVAARTCLGANAASTAAIVRGVGAEAWLRARSLPARLVAPSGSVTTLGGWPREEYA